MSTSFAYAQVGGSLGKDPEVRSLPSGVKVVNFSIAVEQGFGDKASTGWHNCVSFGDAALFAEKYLKKGSSVRVSGSLQVRSWDDKQTGAKRYVTEVIAHKIDFLESRSKSDSGQTTRAAAPAQTRQQAAPAPRATTPANDSPFDSDDDIPF
jgi:single-strand DNA-binding protein